MTAASEPEHAETWGRHVISFNSGHKGTEPRVWGGVMQGSRLGGGSV